MSFRIEARNIVCMHKRKLLYFCQTCRERICRGCLKSAHATHLWHMDQLYLSSLTKGKGDEMEMCCGKIIGEIERATETFRTTCKKLIQVFSKEGAEIRRLKSLETAQCLLWSRQKAEIQSLMNGWKMRKANVRSLSDLASAVEWMVNGLEKVKTVEYCTVDIAKKRTGWNGLRLMTSPSSEKTIVEVVGECNVNKMNTCRVIVKNAIDEIVENDVEYYLSVLLVDDEDKPLDVIVQNEKNGLYIIRYFPTATCQHKLFVSIDSIPVRDTPLSLWVTDNSYGREGPTVIGESGTGKGFFSRPWGVCCDFSGKIYIADRSNNRIQILNENGQFLREFGGEGDRPGELKRPAGIAVDSRQRIIVADKDNHRIQIFESDGSYIHHFGEFDTEEESLHYPWDVAVNKNDFIAVTEGKKHRVRLFSEMGIKIAECVFKPEMQLDSPRGVTALPDGSFLVTDFNEHKIVRLNENFRVVAVLGYQGIEAEDFCRPQSVAIRGDGMIAISDSKNKRVKLYQRNILIRIIEDFFESPQGIAFHPNGSLIVVDSVQNQIQIFDKEHLV